MFDAELIKLMPGFVGGGAVTIIILVIVFLLRESILAALSRSVQRDIESKRATLQKDLEQWKSELEEEKERLKHELTKEAMKAQLVTEKTHEVYTKLFEKLRMAEGAVGMLTGFRMVPLWENYSDSEIQKFFGRYAVSKERIDKVIATIDRADKIRGFKSVQDLHYEMELHVGEKSTREAKNFAIINELYLSDEIRDLVFDMCKLLSSIRIDADLGRMEQSLITKAIEAAKQLEPRMSNLRAHMRKELGSV